MRVLLDEMLPAGLAGLLPDQDVTTVHRAGFAGLTNGELLRRAVLEGCDVLLTADRNLPSQQSVAVSGIAVVLVRGSRMSELSPMARTIDEAVSAALPGTVHRVDPA